MKYLVIARGFNEPDNNTASDVLWAKMTDIDPKDMARYEKVYTSEFENDYEHGVSIDFYPADELEDEWIKVSEIW